VPAVLNKGSWSQLYKNGVIDRRDAHVLCIHIDRRRPVKVIKVANQQFVASDTRVVAGTRASECGVVVLAKLATQKKTPNPLKQGKVEQGLATNHI
jgi:hypothetical protein